jgi:hypothetical protein
MMRRFMTILTKYYLGYGTKNNRMSGTHARMWNRRDAYRVLIGKLKTRDHLENNIKTVT